VPQGPSVRIFVVLGVAMLFVAASSSVWHFFASQIPSSIYHASALPGPVAALREAAAFLGLASLVVAALRPWLGEKEPLVLAIGAAVGCAITVAALAWGATTGMYGVQLDDPRPVTVRLLWLRGTGEAVLAVVFVDLARRLLLGALRKR